MSDATEGLRRPLACSLPVRRAKAAGSSAQAKSTASPRRHLWYRGRMDWRRLLGRDPGPNPETQELIRCDLCEGTGFKLRKGEVWVPAGGSLRCPKCGGKGWLTVDKPPD
jgi:hypothetical protein